MHAKYLTKQCTCPTGPFGPCDSCKSTTDADVQRAVLKLLAQIRSVPVVGPSALQGTGGGLSSAAATSANVAEIGRAHV